MDPRPDHGETSYKGSGRLNGRKALITGGDSGMGRAAAIAFAREGADVAINYLPAEEPDAREVMEMVTAAGRVGVAIPGDLRDESFCGRLVSDAVAGLGGLDILVCNAARQRSHESILDISTEEFDWTMKTNVYAPFWIIRAALPHLPVGASIIATASEQAYDPGSADLYDYAQTKANGHHELREVARKAAGPKRESGSTGWLPARSGLPFRSVAEQSRRSSRNLERRRPSAGRASPANSPPSMSSSRTTTRGLPTDRSTVRPAAPGSPESRECRMQGCFGTTQCCNKESSLMSMG